jgi:hypothetical protein
VICTELKLQESATYCSRVNLNEKCRVTWRVQKEAIKDSEAFIYFCLWGRSGTKSTITASIYWPIVPDGDDYGEISGMNKGQGKLKYLEETFPRATLSATDPT